MADTTNVQGTTSPEATESESEQDLAQLGDEESGESDAETDDGDSDSESDEGEDREPAYRARARTEETEEDTDEEEDAEEETESELEDILEEEEVKDQPAYARPPIKAIKEKYPNFFKEFPQLKAAFFGYPQYTEIFADVDSAREAATKASEYDNLEATLVGNGDPKFLLNTLNENNPKAFKKIVENFASTVRTVDQQRYIELSTPIIEELLYHAAAHGSKVGNKNLQLAARHLANFVFANGGEIPDISKKTPSQEPSEAEQQLDYERQIHAKEKFNSALEDVVKIISPDMNTLINNKLEGLSTFEKKQIFKETRTEIDRILSSDAGFQQTLRNLWKKAAEQNYNQESKSRIKRAWLDRARLLIPSVRNRLKQEALTSKKAPGSRVSRESEEEKPRIKFKVSAEKRAFPEKGGKTPSGQQRRVLDPKKIDWRKTSDRDILDM